jgi:hypothetical protein
MNGIVFSICLNAGCAVFAPNGLWWQGQCVFGPCNEQRVPPRASIVRPPREETPVPPPVASPQRTPNDQLEGGLEVPLTPSVPSHPPRPYLQR